MISFARVREPEKGNPFCECIHNRELEHEVNPELTYFVMSDDVHEKWGIDYELGEMLSTALTSVTPTTVKTGAFGLPKQLTLISLR